MHEYTFDEMRQEVGAITSSFELQGLNGNDRVNKYYEENGKFVRMILKWDVFKLHQRLPSAWLTKAIQPGYQFDAKQVEKKVQTTTDISTKDFHFKTSNLDRCWDIYLIATKNW